MRPLSEQTPREDRSQLLHRPNLAQPAAACDILLWKLAVGVGLTTQCEDSLTVDYRKTDVLTSEVDLAVCPVLLQDSEQTPVLLSKLKYTLCDLFCENVILP